MDLWLWRLTQVELKAELKELPSDLGRSVHLSQLSVELLRTALDGLSSRARGRLFSRALGDLATETLREA